MFHRSADSKEISQQCTTATVPRGPLGGLPSLSYGEGHHASRQRSVTSTSQWSPVISSVTFQDC